MKTFKYSVHLPFQNYFLLEIKSILSQDYPLESSPNSKQGRTMRRSQILVQKGSNKASCFCDILMLSICRWFSELTHEYHNCIVVHGVFMATRWWCDCAIGAAGGFAILLFRGRLIRTGKCPVPWPLTKPRRVRWLCCSTLVFYPCRRAKEEY